ncbi:MAG TPA: hypothetical protein VHX44_18480 [Planctomycetota bacterium]|jgi:hypothetical protein|nr:hypothetical protein [Planctomycetota bacterium]
MKSEARAIYWEFALRLVTRAEVASWADKAIAVGFRNEELFELSTCAELDDNDVMRLLTAMSIGYDKKKVEQRLIATFIAYYSAVDSSKNVNASLLSDYEQIVDLSPDVHSALLWLNDEIALSREGVRWLRVHESKAIIERMSKFLSDTPTAHS